MRFLLLVRSTPASESGQMPSRELIEQMMKFNEDLASAGVLLGLDGLHPSSKGARVRFADGQVFVTDGPFAETKELIAGYWLIRVDSKEEAIAWAKRCPPPFGDETEGTIEIRQVFDIDDFPSEFIDPKAVETVSAAVGGQ